MAKARRTAMAIQLVLKRTVSTPYVIPTGMISGWRVDQ